MIVNYDQVLDDQAQSDDWTDGSVAFQSTAARRTETGIEGGLEADVHARPAAASQRSSAR